jgi:hypothetical protein
LAPLITALVPYLPPEIVPLAAVARMQRAAGSLFPVSGIAFEARLAGEAPAIDLCVRVTPADGSAAILGGWHRRYSLSQSVADDPTWQRLSRLSRVLWGADDTLLRPFVNRLGLELDQADLDGACPQPSIAFFDVPDTVGSQSVGLVKTMTDIVLPLALERVLSDGQRRMIAAAVGAASPFARLRHVGASLRRPDPAVRLVFGLPLDRVGACLAALGLGDRANAIGFAAAIIAGDLADIALQVDVTERLGSRIGIEFHASKAAAWKGLLTRLAIHRLCSPARAIALAGWQRAPAELQGGGDADYTSCLPDDPARLEEGLPVRLINHAKLSFMPDGKLEAKIYLYAGFVWRRMRS